MNGGFLLRSQPPQYVAFLHLQLHWDTDKAFKIFYGNIYIEFPAARPFRRTEPWLAPVYQRGSQLLRSRSRPEQCVDSALKMVVFLWFNFSFRRTSLLDFNSKETHFCGVLQLKLQLGHGKILHC